MFECWRINEDACPIVSILEDENSRLRAENERLSELLWGSRCVYCGEVVGKDKKNQETADNVLRAHVETCPKHPVSKLRKENEQLKADLAADQERWRPVEAAWNDDNTRVSRIIDAVGEAMEGR